MQMVSGFNHAFLVLWVSHWCLVMAFLIILVKTRQRVFRRRGLAPWGQMSRLAARNRGAGFGFLRPRPWVPR